MNILFIVSNEVVDAMFRHDLIPFDCRVWMSGGTLLVLWPRALPMPEGPHRFDGIDNPLAAIVLLDLAAAAEVFLLGILPYTAMIWWDSGVGCVIVWALD